MTARAAGSSDATIRGARAAKSTGCAAAAKATTPSGPPYSSSSDSRQRRHRLAARRPRAGSATSIDRPIQAPDPSSPSTSPHPPICRTTPARCTAKTDPVPIAATIPSSPRQRALHGDQRVRLDPQRANGRPARKLRHAAGDIRPGKAQTADQVAQRRRRRAAPRARRPGCCVARASGSEAMFAGPPCASPRTWPDASHTAARHPVPPPSIPRNSAMATLSEDKIPKQYQMGRTIMMQRRSHARNRPWEQMSLQLVLVWHCQGSRGNQMTDRRTEACIHRPPGCRMPRRDEVLARLLDAQIAAAAAGPRRRLPALARRRRGGGHGAALRGTPGLCRGGQSRASWRWRTVWSLRAPSASRPTARRCCLQAVPTPSAHDRRGRG